MKGLIVAAGYGTRFLPVTKTVPKEMLPLIDTPSIDLIVREFIGSGIEDILIISSRRKKVLEDYFDREVELETLFRNEGADDKLDKIAPPKGNIFFIRQQEMMGTGHALMQAEPFIGSDPFVVAYPDDLHIGEPPLTAQLIDMYNETGCSVMATIHNPPNINRYGVLEVAEDDLHVTGMVEKPAPGKEPSKEVSIGRYLYTPDIFAWLREGWEKHSGGEYYHTYALDRLMEQNRVVYKRAEGTRLDTGSPAGYLRAILSYAWTDPELRQVMQEELSRLDSQ